MRELLGGKGANVAEMTRILGSDRVPAGFTITTEASVRYMRDGVEPEGLDAQVDQALARLEERAGKRLGDPDDPLLVSVRSGARESMPGMLDTVLNLGLNNASVQGLTRATGNPRFAWDSYRRFVQMFGNVVRGVPGERIEEEIAALKTRRGVELDTDLGVDDLRELVTTFGAIYREQTNEDFPQEPREQLRQAIRAVFDSWNGERAVQYRRLNRIPDEWGTAVNVQQMVFGNKGDTSGSGVAFSRDEMTGAPEPSGDFLVNAQGEDVVSGVRNTQELAELADVHARRLHRAARDPPQAGAPLRRHAGHGVHDRGRAAVPAPDPQRQASGAGGRALRRGRRRGGSARPGAGRRHDRRRLPRGAAASDLRPRGRVRGALQGCRRLARRGQGRDRLPGRRSGRRRRGGSRGDPRAPVHRGRRRRRLPRRSGHSHQRGRQGLARRAGGARHGAALRRRRERARHRPRRAHPARGRHRPARGRPDRDQRHDAATSRSTTSR